MSDNPYKLQSKLVLKLKEDNSTDKNRKDEYTNNFLNLENRIIKIEVLPLHNIQGNPTDSRVTSGSRCISDL